MSEKGSTRSKILDGYCERNAYHWRWENMFAELAVATPDIANLPEDRRATIVRSAAKMTRGLYRLKRADWEAKTGKWTDSEKTRLLRILDFAATV